MVCRIILILLLLCSATYSQEIKISNVGIKDLSNFMIKDFTFAGEFENLFILEDVDTLSYLYFKGWKDEVSIEELKKILGYVKNKKALDELGLESFRTLQKKNKKSEFKKILDEFQFSEEIKLLYAINSMDYQVSFENVIYRDFLKSYENYEKGNLQEALKILDPHKTYFPHTYICFLLLLNETGKAKEYIKKLGIKDKELVLLVDYLSEDCDNVLNYFNETYNYAFELMKMDCSLKKGINYVVPKLSEDLPLKLEDDDFTIIRLFFSKKKLFHEKIYPLFQTYYVRWKLLSYISFLESYRQDIELFKLKLKDIKDEYNVLRKRYLSDIGRISSSSSDIMRKKINDLDNLMENIDRVEVIRFSIKDTKDIYNEMQRAYKDAKNKLIKGYLTFLSFLSEEEERLKLELEFRILEEEISNVKSFNLTDIDKLIVRLDELMLKGRNKNVSYAQKGIYNKIYLLWNRYLTQKVSDYKKRTEELKNIIVFIENNEEILKSYPDVYLILAEANDHYGNTEQALENFQRFVHKNKKTDIQPNIYIKIGDLLFDKKMYDSARRNYLKAKAYGGVYEVVSTYKIAWTYYVEENYKMVLDTLLGSEIYTKGGISEMLLNEVIDLIAKTFYKKGDGKRAENYLARNTIFPYPEKVFKSLGDLYVSLAEYENAIEVYERGLKLYYLNYNSPSLLISKIELLTFLGKEREAYNEKLRFNDLYKKGSLYYEKFHEIPKEYEEIILSAGYYYSNKYERTEDKDAYNISTNLLLDYLNSLGDSKKSGEVNFLLGQLYFENKDFFKASEYYKKAYIAKFKEEESFYGYLNSLYFLWERGEVQNEHIIKEIKKFIEIFPNSNKTIKISLLLADLYIKNGFERDALNTINEFLEKTNSAYVEDFAVFIQGRFDKLQDKIELSKIFEKVYLKTGQKKYLEMKHFSLFVYAQKLEQEKRFELARDIYRLITNDKFNTKFKQPSLYNQAILESYLGDKKRALEIMKEVSEEELKKKALDFMYSIGLETGNFDFAGESAEKLGIRDNRNDLLLKSVWFYLKVGRLDDARRVIYLLKNRTLNNSEKEKVSIYEGIYFYKINDIKKSGQIFIELLVSKKFGNFGLEEVFLLNELTKRAIFTFSDDRAKEFLEGFIDLCSAKYQETGSLEYQYILGSILVDYNIFFIDKEYAFNKGIEVLKTALKQSIENEEIESTKKIISKIKEIMPEFKTKKFFLPPIEIEKEIFLFGELR
ncbi:MAG: hypothetical protein N2202_04820 [Proteobacteria bacterium]|nr:hypothetical protein [Pseudomonadota bacterium]